MTLRDEFDGHMPRLKIPRPKNWKGRGFEDLKVLKIWHHYYC